jgi:predicted permease
MDNVRYSLRQFRRNPGFALTVIITLALGIGANTAIFSMLEGVVLSPLPFSDSERLVLVWQSNPRSPHVSISGPDFRDWQRSATPFEQMAAIRWQARDLTNPGTPEHLEGREISAGYFTMLGVNLILGRDFTADEDQRGGRPAVLIGEGLWRERFGGSGDVLGRIVTLDGADYAITGVVPSGFGLGSDREADVYTPLGQGDPVMMTNRAVHPGILCIARLKPGVMPVQAKSQMIVVQNGLDQLYPVEDRGLSADVVLLKKEIVGDSGGMLYLLLGVVGLVLLIACANIANLLLARLAARSREFATRTALGATRSHIVKQAMTEGILLSLLGGCLGLALAKWGLIPALVSLSTHLPRAGNVTVNIPVLLATLGLVIAVGVLIGVAPALKGSKVDLQGTLKQGGRGILGGQHRMQRGLVVVQMGLTLVLLTGAILLFRTIRHLWAIDPGFNAQHVVTFKIGLSPSVTKTPSTWRTAYQQLIDRIQQVPAVESADITGIVPLSQQDNSVPYWLGAQETTSAAEARRALLFWTAPEYVKTMKIPVLQGRFLTQADLTSSEPVIVIDSTMAHSAFPDKNPVGQAIRVASWGTVRIVGVVGHVNHRGLGEAGASTQNQIYASIYQLPDAWVPAIFSNLTVIVRSRVDVAALLSAVKGVVYGTGNDQPVYAVETMEDIISKSIAGRRFPMVLLGAFAGLALILATVGIYGVISYVTAERVYEIGIRMALGAEKKDVLRMVIAQGLRLALVGVATGTVATLVLGPVVSSFSHLLYGIRPWDPVTLIAVSFVLLSAAMLACYVPARRAAGVDPIVALRHD